ARAIAASPAPKLLLPIPAEGWHWAGMSELKTQDTIRQTVHAVKQFAAGEEIKAKRGLSAGAIIAIVVGSLLLLSFAIPLLIYTGETLLTDNPTNDSDAAWSPDGRRIAFVSDRAGTRSVWKVGQFGGAATLALEDAEYPAISPDGTGIAFSRADDSRFLRIWLASLNNPSDATMLTAGEHGLWDHVGVAWSPDGKTLSYSAQANLWTVPAEGGSPRRLTRNREGGTGSAWSSDGRCIYFDSCSRRTLALWRVPSRGGEPRLMTQGTGYESEPDVSADGSRLTYSTGSLGTGAVLVDLATGQQTTIGRLRYEAMASLSPDGSRLIYVSERWDGRGELAEQQLDDGVPAGSPVRLTDQEGTASHPFYSPDGRWIAYYLILRGKRDIWIIPSGGGRPIQFTSDSEQDVLPAWSPAGDMLAFVSRRAETYDVWVAPVREGSPAGEPRRITDGSVLAVSPVWSPDGTEIAFVGSADGRREVWVVPADGAAPARRLTEGVDATRIRWDVASGTILAAATCGEESRTLWAISPGTGEAIPFEPAVVFGTERAIGLFDLSQEGRLLVFSRENLTGDIWVSEGPPGTY
ncbi:MAG: hypothetical protein U9Q95_04725, partial [Candidatus Eisenbacteria bacterium]|nr:hypothetical protein [Candidatus Eisenbacteria bacterium]